MKLFIESIMIFFGTLMAAALVALGEPGGTELAIMKSPMPMPRPGTARRLEAHHNYVMPEWSAMATSALLLLR